MNRVMEIGYRSDPPSHFEVKVENFGIFKEKIDRYESEAFEASGYKWKLVLYPNGKVRSGGPKYVSMYLAMAEEDTLPIGWQVRAYFKMFVFDFNKDQYYTVRDEGGRLWRFQDMKKEWGFDKVLPVEDINADKGYLSEDDTCLFGVEIFVVKYEGNGESASPIDNVEKIPFSWIVPKFSKLDGGPLFSSVFVTFEEKWKLALCSKGDAEARDRTLSLYLNLVIPPVQKMSVRYKLRIKNNVEGFGDKEKEDSIMFSSAATSHILLDDLEHPSNGFLWNEDITIEVDILTIVIVKDFY